MHAEHGTHTEPEDAVARRVRREVRRGTHIASLAVVAGVLLLIIGGQAYLKQADDNRDDERIRDAVNRLEAVTECIKTWGEDFAETTTTRTGGNASKGSVDLERAAERRAAALDQIILTVIAARSIPPTAGAKEFDRSLREYAAALRNLERVSRDVDQTRALNPYPKLSCDKE